MGADGRTQTLTYAYDAAGNITRRNDNGYAYDELNRLIAANIKGTFRDQAPGLNGYTTADFFGTADLNFAIPQSLLSVG